MSQPAGAPFPDPRQRRRRQRWLGGLLLLAMLGVATGVRVPGIGWGVRLEDGAPPEVPRTDEGTFLGHFKHYPSYNNVYVPQTAVHALLLFPVAKWVARQVDPTHLTTNYFILQVGRTASLLASLGFLVLVFCGGRAFGLRRPVERVLATGLLAFSPLLSVYGHLFVADSLNLLWIWLAFYLFVRFAERRQLQHAVLFAMVTGFAGATKFSVTYCAIPGLAILLLSRRPLTTALMMALVATGAFWIGTGFTYDMGKLEWAHEFLTNIRSGNRIAIDIGTNLLNQAAFILSATGTPALILAAAGMIAGAGRGLLWARRRLRWPAGPLRAAGRWLLRPARLVRRAREWVAAHPMAVIYASLGAQFVLFATSGIGGFFARHVIPFVPALVVVAARTLGRMPWMARPRVAAVATGALLAYQLVLCLDGERPFYNEPRQQAREWLKQHRDEGTFVYHGPYSHLVVKGLPRTRGVRHLGPSPVPPKWLPDDHLLVTQQASFGRYFLADTCDKIQHCWGEEPARRFFTRLIAGRDPRYRLLYAAAPGYAMPEHLLLARIVPNHPLPDMGEVLIYRHVAKDD